MLMEDVEMTAGAGVGGAWVGVDGRALNGVGDGVWAGCGEAFSAV
jgi:hypothetical protein